MAALCTGSGRGISRAAVGVFSCRMSSAAALAPPPSVGRVPLTTEENLALRRRHLAPSQKIHYDGQEGGPLHLSRGEGAYLYDINNVRHLDCVNNVAHVGHCHPRIVAAATRQLSTLNTNSRYVHDNISRLAATLAATFPEPLSSVFFVNSGTEANDLAMRLVRNHTKRQPIYCVDGAYHGHSIATLSISPYSKYAVAESAPGAVKLMQPDVYRLGLTEAEATQMALRQYRDMLASKSDEPPAAYIVESIMCCGGQVQLPRGYLQGVYELTRAAGGLTIADEVQTGFGRTGDHYWAFEAHGVVPDIVTVGKPFGNGFPLAAVVTTSAVAESFRTSEYFNTFGGNTVACAVGLEVLQVIEEEALQANARAVGASVLELLRRVASRHPRVGDVRGRGLLVGVEFVLVGDRRDPDAQLAAFVMQRMRRAGVLVSTDGPHRNVIKIKPPLCFSQQDAETLAEAMDLALRSARQPK